MDERKRKILVGCSRFCVLVLTLQYFEFPDRTDYSILSDSVIGCLLADTQNLQCNAIVIDELSVYKTFYQIIVLTHKFMYIFCDSSASKIFCISNHSFL